ncbi:MAG TPA: hypothetical protein VMW41_05485 [Candidatus Bathyarchaeia archaeon]|nr:hypothetical protein [Candidatus Bathyarchaeia archaeon]
MIKKIARVLIFLFVLGVFGFSLYKILAISGIWKTKVLSLADDGCSGNCFCPGIGGWCDSSWCGGCQPCSSPTPTTAEMPTPTPGEGLSPTPTIPEEPSSTPTPAEELSPTPTPVPVSTPTAVPPSSSSGGGGGLGGPGEPPHCGAATPLAPVLLSADRLEKRDQVLLKWTAVDLATHYALSYGLTSRNYQFGVADAGRVTSFNVAGLDPGTDYCFAVRAVNDCAPGELSNEICLGTAAGGGRILGAAVLGATGSFDWQKAALWFYTGGCLCLGIGVRILVKASAPQV